MAATTPAGTYAFPHAVKRARDALHTLKSRLALVVALQEQLERVSRGKTFTIHNDLMWLCAFDARDMCVIRLVDWAKAEQQRGGLFRILPSHSKRFSKKRAWTDADEPDDPGYARELDEAHANSFRKLFPNCTTRHPKPADIELLRTRFNDMMKPLADDRSQNRVHLAEHQRRGQGSAKLLSPGGVMKVQKRCEKLLTRIGHVALGPSWSFHPLSSRPAGDAAEDICDQILLGSLWRIGLTKRQQMRDEFWAAAHERHDARGVPPDEPPFFNDWEFTNPGE